MLLRKALTKLKFVERHKENIMTKESGPKTYIGEEYWE